MDLIVCLTLLLHNRYLSITSGTFTSRKGSLTGDATDFFTFTQFGNYVVASNGEDDPLYYLMGTSTTLQICLLLQQLVLHQCLE
jgi:hypothetical protein